MSLNRYRLRHQARSGHRGARVAEWLLLRPDRLIGLILLGNNAREPHGGRPRDDPRATLGRSRSRAPRHLRPHDRRSDLLRGCAENDRGAEPRSNRAAGSADLLPPSEADLSRRLAAEPARKRSTAPFGRSAGSDRIALLERRGAANGRRRGRRHGPAPPSAHAAQHPRSRRHHRRRHHGAAAGNRRARSRSLMGREPRGDSDEPARPAARLPRVHRQHHRRHSHPRPVARAGTR